MQTHYSGILVVTLPGRLDGCAAHLRDLLGVTVSLTEPARQRLIAVAEGRSPEDLVDLLGRIRAVPGVALAEPVVHYVDDESEKAAPPGAANLHAR